MEIKQKTSQALDHFADHSIKIMSEALAEKDQIIQGLQQKMANCPTCRKEIAHE